MGKTEESEFLDIVLILAFVLDAFRSFLSIQCPNSIVHTTAQARKSCKGVGSS